MATNANVLPPAEPAVFCSCMTGPNDPDPKCLYCGGTGVWVSDERLEQLRESYAYLTDAAHYRYDFKVSDRQHLAIVMALQSARRVK